MVVAYTLAHFFFCEISVKPLAVTGKIHIFVPKYNCTINNNYKNENCL